MRISSFILLRGQKCLLGEVVGIYPDHCSGLSRLRVKHFCGKPWKLEPLAGCVEILRE